MRNLTPLFALLLLGSFTPEARAAEGTLLIAGGGRMPDAVYERFLELAGGEGTGLVVIPTASGDEPSVERIAARWSGRGFASVAVLHTRDREVADAAGFADPIDRARAVWISGGAQKRLAASYAGGPVERALRGLVARGGVVAGSSAGAAIQSEVMIVNGNPVPNMGRGFDLAPGVIIDQHFLVRNRFNRLLAAVNERPDRVGVGIDESTAIEVRGGKATVLGESFVVVVEPHAGPVPFAIATYEAGERFTLPAKGPKLASVSVE